MKLMAVDEYIKTRYADNSQPKRRTVIRYITSGMLPGRRQGKFYYVDIDAEKNLTGNTLVDRVLLAR